MKSSIVQSGETPDDLTSMDSVDSPFSGLEKASTLALLHQVSRELNSILDVDVLLGRISELVKQLIDFQLFGLYLWDEDRQVLVNRFCHCFGDCKAQGESLGLGTGVCGAVALMRRPLRVPDVRREPRFLDCDPDSRIRSELAVPLLLKDRLIGVINLESFAVDAFSSQDEVLLGTLGASVAVSVENARLYQELRLKERHLKKDLDMARRVQNGLLPSHSPLLDGLEIGRAYRPALQLGGDFYDFLRCGPERLNIVVGDVSGKSTAAALYGSLAIGILRAQAVESPCSPAQTLAQMNTHLLQPQLDSRFLAMAMAGYCRESRTLTLANAGLPRPILLRDGEIREIQIAGVPLGLLPKMTYEQETIELRDKDVIVLCSDGLHESMDDDEREFGLGGLTDFLKKAADLNAQDIADGLLDASLRHAGRDPAHEDDRTVVVLKVT